MKQPQERLGRDTRRKNFEHAAIVLVSKIGYKAVTTDGVAKQANVSKGLLWRYYANLDELMLDAAKRALHDLEMIVANGLDLEQPVPDLLHETIHRAAELPKSHHDELLAIQRIVINLRLPDGSQAINEANSYQSLYTNQSAIFKRGQQEGHIKQTVDPELFARIYQGTVDTMIDQLISDPQLDSTQYADCASDIILNGIST